MDYFASHEKAVQEMPGRTSVILAVAIVAVGLLLCTGLFERVKAEDGADLLLTLQVKSDQPVTAVMDGITKRAAALGAYKEGVVQIDRKTVSVQAARLQRRNREGSAHYGEARIVGVQARGQ